VVEKGLSKLKEELVKFYKHMIVNNKKVHKCL